jgi:TolA-binding protein
MAIPNRVKSLLVATSWVFLLAYVSGCAYFNTFYHAKQFYGQAERARASEHGQPGAGSASSNFYKQAIQKCERVIQKYPGSKWEDDAYLVMAESHYWRGDYLSAQEALTSLLGLKESSLRDQGLYWQGRTSLAQENYTDAQSIWQTLLKEYPKFKDREEVEYYMAQASWLGGDPDVAVHEYQTLLKRYPNGEHAAAARLDLGDLLVEQKRYDEAEKVFAYVTQKGKLEEDRIEARISLGDVLEKQDRNQDALKLYTDLEVSLDASARKGRMTWQARQQMELEEQQRRDQAMQDSIRLASLNQMGTDNTGQAQQPLQRDAAGNYLDPSGNIIDPSLVDQNGNLIDPNGVFTQNQKPSSTLARKTPTLQRDVNDPRQKDLAQVLIREGCVLANLQRSDDAITAFQQVVAEYPGTPFAAEAQYRIGYTYEVHKEEFDQAQRAYDAVSRQGNSSFRDEAGRRSKNLVTLKTLMATASKDSASTATSAAAETRFMKAELYLFQQENIDKAVDEYASIEKEFKGTEHAAKAGLALAWIMEHDRGDSAHAMAKYTEVAEQYPNTEYGRRAHEVVYGPEPEPQSGDFEGPSLAELITPENQQSAYAQALGDSAAQVGQQNLAATGGGLSPNGPGGIAPGVVLGGGAAALAHTGMAPDETGPPLLANIPTDSVLYAGPGPADPATVAGLTQPGATPNTQPGYTPPSPQPASASAAGNMVGGPSVGTTAAGATGAVAGTAGGATAGAAGAATAGSLGAMVKATREHGATPETTGAAHAVNPGADVLDSTQAPHDSTNIQAATAIPVSTALPGGVYLDPLAVPVDGPSPVTKPDTTGAERKAVPPPTPPSETGPPAEHKSNEKVTTNPSKSSKSSATSGKNSSKKAKKPSASGKSDEKGAAPDSTSGKGSP